MQPYEKQYQQLLSIVDRLEELDSVVKPNGREIESELITLARELKNTQEEIGFLTEPHTPERFIKLLDKANKYLDSVLNTWRIPTKESICRQFGPIDDDMNWDS